MAIYRIAAILHKTVSEVFEMSAQEFDGWAAYLKIIDGE